MDVKLNKGVEEIAVAYLKSTLYVLKKAEEVYPVSVTAGKTIFITGVEFWTVIM